ncbi:hypothetical protein QAD02_003584 [Eretmocerus hayati]|uniref:Uncharacterized protein n=1 Tax=Eretmocerus hayati TaxID=131215 RepID=A0ACC2NM38_9HYME|nr:hypothetical protein QAD02_003584 [Eretmocerus hayati]
MIWLLSKLKINDDGSISLDDDIVVPTWSVFMQMNDEENCPVTTVGFCPLIPYPPTSYNVVYTAMMTYESLCEQNGKEFCVITGDMAIFLIMKLIQMKPTRFCSKSIAMIGTLHLQKTFLVYLGQFLDGCGIDEI